MTIRGQYSKEGVNRLFDHILRTYKVKNDTAFAEAIGAQRPNVSKVRNGHVGMGDAWVIAIHEVYGMSIKEIKGILNGQ